jgi:hypothetical protein
VELESMRALLGNQEPRLARAGLALVRIDTGLTPIGDGCGAAGAVVRAETSGGGPAVRRATVAESTTPRNAHAGRLAISSALFMSACAAQCRGSLFVNISDDRPRSVPAHL